MTLTAAKIHMEYTFTYNILLGDPAAIYAMINCMEADALGRTGHVRGSIIGLLRASASGYAASNHLDTEYQNPASVIEIWVTSSSSTGFTNITVRDEGRLVADKDLHITPFINFPIERILYEIRPLVTKCCSEDDQSRFADLVNSKEYFQ